MTGGAASSDAGMTFGTKAGGRDGGAFGMVSTSAPPGGRESSCAGKVPGRAVAVLAAGGMLTTSTAGFGGTTGVAVSSPAASFEISAPGRLDPRGAMPGDEASGFAPPSKRDDKSGFLATGGHTRNDLMNGMALAQTSGTGTATDNSSGGTGGTAESGTGSSGGGSTGGGQAEEFSGSAKPASADLSTSEEQALIQRGWQ